MLNTTPGKPVGFSKGSIGVKETASETFCNQIDTTSPNIFKPVPETLVLALPTGLTDPDFGALKATSASLDVELRNANSRILVTAKLGGATQANYELRTGTFVKPATTSLVPDLPYEVTAKPGATKDSNVQWQIGTPDDGITFDSLSIRAYNGAISLEGKADADSTSTTSIDLGYVATDVVNACDALLADGLIECSVHRQCHLRRHQLRVLQRGSE